MAFGGAKCGRKWAKAGRRLARANLGSDSQPFAQLAEFCGHFLQFSIFVTRFNPGPGLVSALDGPTLGEGGGGQPGAVFHPAQTFQPLSWNPPPGPGVHKRHPGCAYWLSGLRASAAGRPPAPPHTDLLPSAGWSRRVPFLGKIKKEMQNSHVPWKRRPLWLLHFSILYFLLSVFQISATVCLSFRRGKGGGGASVASVTFKSERMCGVCVRWPVRAHTCVWCGVRACVCAHGRVGVGE